MRFSAKPSLEEDEIESSSFGASVIFFFFLGGGGWVRFWDVGIGMVISLRVLAYDL